MRVEPKLNLNAKIVKWISDLSLSSGKQVDCIIEDLITAAFQDIETRRVATICKNTSHNKTSPSSLSGDWLPSDKMRSRWENEGYDVDWELETFRNYWLNKPGEKKISWDMTFDNWIRRHIVQGEARRRTGKDTDTYPIRLYPLDYPGIDGSFCLRSAHNAGYGNQTYFVTYPDAMTLPGPGIDIYRPPRPLPAKIGPGCWGYAEWLVLEQHRGFDRPPVPKSIQWVIQTDLSDQGELSLEKPSAPTPGPKDGDC